MLPFYSVINTTASERGHDVPKAVSKKTESRNKRVRKTKRGEKQAFRTKGVGLRPTEGPMKGLRSIIGCRIERAGKYCPLCQILCVNDSNLLNYIV